jgi:hypothetical protein
MQALTKTPGAFPLRAEIFAGNNLPEKIVDHIDNRAVAEIDE